MNKQQMVELAEAQLTGFAHAAQGYSIEHLAESMGLTYTEWCMIKARGVNYLTATMIEEIDKMFST